MLLDPSALLSAVRAARNSGERIDILDYKASSPSSGATTSNEYCFFLKPEFAILKLPIFERAIAIVNESLGAFDKSVVALAALPGRYLERHDLMARHYGVINRASRLGLAALSTSGRSRAARLLEQSDVQSTDVLGGHEA